MNFSKHIALNLVLVLGLGVTSVQAQATETPLAAGESGNVVAAPVDWSVFEDGTPKMCWGVSAPKETINADEQGRPKAVKRGRTLLFVTYTQGAGGPVLSFAGGYPFESKSTVTLDIGGTVFNLVTDNETAWSVSPEDDAKIITAMKSGSSAIVKGHSARGTYTTDTFSLLGFTAAIEDAEKRCK